MEKDKNLLTVSHFLLENVALDSYAEVTFVLAFIVPLIPAVKLL